jgi:dTDP-4-amino-4,6-dideoxygalactose transaminase
MEAAGITCGIYYPIPLHRQPYVMELGLEADLPRTDAAAATSLSLPIYPSLTEAEQGTVVEALRASVLRHAVAAGAGS